MFPGAGVNYHSVPPPLAWTGFLLAGIILSGAAGIPLGLVVFSRRKRKMLLKTFWIALIVGAVLEICALMILVLNAFTLPR